MSDMTLAPRRRPLWRLFFMPVLLLIAAAAWSAFWFYSASKVDETADAWRAREAKSGRIYDCASRSVAGYPFRLEVRCDGASVSLVSQTAGQAATQTPITAKLGEILVVSQIYDPKLLIAEFTAPATIVGPGQPSMIANWSKARSSVAGLPGVPQRVSLVFDDQQEETHEPAETRLPHSSVMSLRAWRGGTDRHTQRSFSRKTRQALITRSTK